MEVTPAYKKETVEITTNLDIVKPSTHFGEWASTDLVQINDSYVKDTKEHSGFAGIVFEPSTKKELKITDSHAN